MYAIKYNADPDARLWESGKPIGWIITRDGNWPFFTRDERDEIVNTIRAEAIRLEVTA